MSLRTLGSGKTKGHTSVPMKRLLSLQLTHTLSKGLNGVSSHEWSSTTQIAIQPWSFLHLSEQTEQRKCFCPLHFRKTLLIAKLNCVPAGLQTLPICISQTPLNYKSLSLAITSQHRGLAKILLPNSSGPLPSYLLLLCSSPVLKSASSTQTSWTQAPCSAHGHKEHERNLSSRLLGAYRSLTTMRQRLAEEGKACPST